MRNVTHQQIPLFIEAIETVVTRDYVSDAGVFIRRPPGRGWRVLDAHRERYTKWERRRPVMLPRLLWRRRC
jgi:hypothetical protein